MLQAAIAGLIVFSIFKFLERGRDSVIDGWMSFGFVLVPALLIFLLSFGIRMAGLPPWLLLFALLLYFIAPLLMLKYQLDVPWGRSFAYGGIVFVVALVVDFGLSYGMAAASA